MKRRNLLQRMTAVILAAGMTVSALGCTGNGLSASAKNLTEQVKSGGEDTEVPSAEKRNGKGAAVWMRRLPNPISNFR